MRAPFRHLGVALRAGLHAEVPVGVALHRFLFLALLVLAPMSPARANPWAAGFSPAGADAAVDAVLELDGKVYIGGDFSVIGAVAASRVAVGEAIAGGGWRWRPLGDGLDGTVFELVAHEGGVYACGKFHHSGSAAIEGVAMWDGAAWRPVGDGLPAPIMHLASYAGALYASGGIYDTNWVRRWDGNAWQTILNAGDMVNGLRVLGGKLVVFGWFRAIDGVPYDAVATWDGTALGREYQAPGGQINDMSSYGGQVIAVGYIPIGSPSTATFVCRWNGSAWESMGSPPSYSREGFTRLAVLGSELYSAGGRALAFDGPGVCTLRRWDGAAWQVVGNEVTSAEIDAIHLGESGLWVGGRFARLGSAADRNLALLQGTNWVSLFPEARGPDAPVCSFTVHDGRLIAAGRFQYAGGVESPLAAAWDGQAWSALGAWGYGYSTLSLSAVMNRIYSSGTGLFGSGSLETYDCYKAGWNGSYWLPLTNEYIPDSAEWAGGRAEIVTANGFNPPRFVRNYAGSQATSLGDYIGSLWDLAAWGNRLVAVGAFTSIGGVTGANVAAYSGGAWSGIGGGTDSDTYAAGEYGGDLVVAGSFTTAGGVPCASIARWDGTNWSPLGGGITGTVSALVNYGSYLVAGGSFTQAGGVPAANVAAWDGARWWPLLGGTNGAVDALAVYAGDLYLGGEFSQAGGLVSNGIARWRGDLVTGAPDPGLPAHPDLLLSVVPNPFNPRVEVRFTLARGGAVTVDVHDLRGRCVRTLPVAELAAGEHAVTWDGCDIGGKAAPSGTYIVRIVTPAGASLSKVSLVR